MAKKFISVTIINKAGSPVKAEVFAGGKSRGFSDEKTGALIFESPYGDKMEGYAKRYGEKTPTVLLDPSKENYLRFTK